MFSDAFMKFALPIDPTCEPCGHQTPLRPIDGAVRRKAEKPKSYPSLMPNIWWNMNPDGTLSMIEQNPISLVRE